MRGTTTDGYPAGVRTHTRNIHTRSTTLHLNLNSRSLLTYKVHHTTSKCPHITQDIHLICLVAQVVVTWPVSVNSSFVTDHQVHLIRASWSSKSPVFRSCHRTLDGYFRSSSAPAHACLTAKLGHSTVSPFFFPFLQAWAVSFTIHYERIHLVTQTRMLSIKGFDTCTTDRTTRPTMSREILENVIVFVSSLLLFQPKIWTSFYHHPSPSPGLWWQVHRNRSRGSSLLHCLFELRVTPTRVGGDPS